MISFDIFDTLIMRKTIYPNGIFLLVQRELEKEEYKKLAHYFINNDFFECRLRAEKDARFYAEQKGMEEVSLKEIYAALINFLAISQEDAMQIMQIEIQMELEHTYPINKNIDLLKSFVCQNEKVILISDMYLNEELIRKLLVSIDPVFATMPIYVSSEYKKTKSSGLLYLLIHKKENVDYNNWIHYGDNIISDYNVPRVLGIDARQVDIDLEPIWEKEIKKIVHVEKNLPMQMLLFRTKLARMENPLLTKGERIGASIGAMVLYPYVCWIISKSIELKVERLYFIARDGYVLKQIADTIIKEQKINIQTRYIYGSREAWRINKNESEKITLLKDYLDQELDLSDDKFSFVDLHGSGYTLDYLTKLFPDKFKMKVKAFYYDLLEARNNNQVYFMAFTSDHTGFIELFGRAPHEVTIGYERKEGKVYPKLAETKNDLREMSGLDDYIRGVQMFLKSPSKWEDVNVLSAFTTIEKIVQYCEFTPNFEILQFFSNLQHNDAAEEQTVYAPRVSSKDLFYIYMWRTTEGISNYYKGANLSYSLLQLNQQDKKKIQFWKKNYHSLLGMSIHLYKKIITKEHIIYKKRQRVIIYGAGKYGQELYESLKYDASKKVVGWADAAYLEYQKKGYKVEDINQSIKKAYDIVMIAIKNSQKQNQVEQLLIEIGIPKEKISRI